MTSYTLSARPIDSSSSCNKIKRAAIVEMEIDLTKIFPEIDFTDPDVVVDRNSSGGGSGFTFAEGLIKEWKWNGDKHLIKVRLGRPTSASVSSYCWSYFSTTWITKNGKFIGWLSLRFCYGTGKDTYPVQLAKSNGETISSAPYTRVCGIPETQAHLLGP